MRITLKIDSGNGNSLATETVHIEPQCIPALTANSIDFPAWNTLTANSKRAELRNGIRSMLTNMPAAQALVTANR